MAQSVITFGVREDMVVAVVKGKYGLKNKSEAVNLIIDKFEQEFLEPQLRPEFVKEIKRLDKKGKFKEFKNVDALRKRIENA